MMTKKWKTHILIYRSVNFYSFISCPIIASLVTDANHRCQNVEKKRKNKTLLPLLYPCCRVSHFHQTLATQLIRIMAATISWKLTTVTPSHQKTWKVCMPVPLSTIPALNFITRPHYENMMLGYCQLVSLNKRFPLFPHFRPRALRIRFEFFPFTCSSSDSFRFLVLSSLDDAHCSMPIPPIVRHTIIYLNFFFSLLLFSVCCIGHTHKHGQCQNKKLVQFNVFLGVAVALDDLRSPSFHSPFT